MTDDNHREAATGHDLLYALGKKSHSIMLSTIY